MSYNYNNLLKEDITIESISSNTVDDRGLQSSSWASASTTKGRLVLINSAEDEDQTELLMDQFELFIPASVTVTSDNRVNISSQYYDILGIETKKNRYGKSLIKVLTVRKSR
tara:strand:- start:502 stop:837 length:336 start_codon:yes stop_codon:yes gene_type:complete